MTKRHLIIATRKSPLAIRQTELVKTALLALHPFLSVELLGITTKADQMQNTTLSEIGGKGLFVKELEEALLDGRADIAVHSMKDVPMDLPSELCLPVMLQREEVRDVFISNHYPSFSALPTGASLGTSSLRRQTQLCAIRSDIQFQNLRGNIQTRLARLDGGDFAAIILAAAGLKRMQLTNRMRDYFSIDQVLPAAGQGALGIECCMEDKGVYALIAPLNHQATNHCVTAERALCRHLGGGCEVPIAAYAHFDQGKLLLRGLVASKAGYPILRAEREGNFKQAEEIGIRVAEELLQQGAQKILKEYL